MADKDGIDPTLLDYGAACVREGFTKGAQDERAAIVGYLRREADAWHEAWKRGGPKREQDLLWRNHAAYSSAAAKVERGAHLSGEPT
jgi:hypothetical protein